MNKPRWFFYLGIGLIGIVLLAGCGSVNARNHRVTEHTAQSSFNKPRTDHRVFEIKVDDVCSSIRFHVRAETSAGSIDWKLTDPNGTVLDGTAAGREIDQARDLTPVPGTWTLEITTARAVGSYDVVFRAQD